MQVDRRTLTDLGVLPAATGDWPLQRFLDHTHGGRARSELHRLLATPLASEAAIAERQALLGVLREALAPVAWDVLGGLSTSVEQYLSSSFVLVPRSAVARARLLLRHGEIADFVCRGLGSTAALLDRIGEVAARIAPLGGDAAFREIADTLGAPDLTSLRARLRAGGVSGAPDAPARFAPCALDADFREDARLVIEQAIAALYRLDAFGSLAEAAAMPGFIYPSVRRGAPLSVEGARHPLVRAATANDVSLESHQRIMYLTGPNMAGKSTLLRTVGLIVHFAHVGLPVPASRATVPLADRLITSLNAEDSLARGESLYLVEVRRVRAVAAAVAAGETVVALLDEAFRGTNVKDASEAMGMLVDGLASASSGVFVLASHLHETAAAREGDARIAAWQMQVGDAANGGAFAYALARGVSDVRLGVQLLEREGVVALLQRIASGGNLPTPSDVPIARA